MRKKRLLLVVTLSLLMTAALGLSACNGKNSNAEIREYGKIVINVAKNSVGKLADVSPTEKKIARAADVRNASVSSDIKNQIFDLIFAQAADTTVEAVKYVFDDVFVQSAFLPAMCGDAIAEKYKAPKFYGVPIFLSDWGQYLITENEGTLKRSYVFMSKKTSWSGTDLFIVIDFDYRSETDFSFSMLQFSDDFSNRMYAYGNSDMEFFYLNRSVYENASRYETYCFRNSAAQTTESGEAAEACLSVLDSQFKGVDRDAVRAKFDSVEYEITNKDLEPHSEKYHGTIGKETSSSEGGFSIQDGVVMEYYEGEDETPTELTLPSSVDAVYGDLRLPASVKKLIIPSNITKIKIEKDRLDSYENSNKPSPGGSELVDCPAKYFYIRQMSQEGYIKTLGEIELDGGSTLFDIKNHCLYAKDGTLLYITENSGITSLTLDGNKMSRAFAEDNLPGLYLPNLKNIDAAIAYISNGEGYAPDIIDPFKQLVSTVFRKKGYSFESVIIRGVGEIDSFVIGKDLSTPDSENDIKSVGTFELYGTKQNDRQSDITVFAHCPVNKIKFGENIENARVHICSEPKDGNGSVNEISVSKDIKHISAGNVNATSNDNVRIVLPWSQIEFEYYAKKFDVLDLSDHMFKELGWGYDTNEHLLKTDGQNYTVVFRPLSDTEKKDAEVIGNFKGVNVSAEHETEIYGYEFIKLSGYCGNGNAIRVPGTLVGYPVAEFTLANSFWDGSDVTIDGVTEVYLPASLERFEFSNYDGKQYDLTKIVYDGTKARFLEIFGGDINDVYSLLRYTDKIVCTDGEYGQQTKEALSFADSDGNTIELKIDWTQSSDERLDAATAITVNYDGQVLKSHRFYNTGYDLSYLDKNNETQSIRISFELRQEYGRKSVVLNFFHNHPIAGGTTIEFNLVSSSEITGEILEHEYDANGICTVCSHNRDA